MENPKLALIPSGYKSGKVYSILPANGVGDFTFTRASEGTRIKENGLIGTELNGIPRLDWGNGDCPSLLLEPQRTNQVTYSYDISLWSTLVGDGSITSTNNFAISPDGSNNATRLQFSTSSYAYKSFVVNGNNSNYVTSLYLKSNNEENQSIFFFCRGNTSNTVVVTPEWQRFEVLGFASGSESAYFYFGEGSGLTNDVDILAWGGQLELNSSYASSYIQTEATPETRLVDTCEVASGLQEYIGQNKGTLFVDFEYLAPIENNSSTDSIRDTFILGKSGNTTDYVTFDNYRSEFRVFINQSGVVSSVSSAVAGSALANTRYRFAIRYESGNSKSFLNGSLLGSSSVNINFGAVLDGIFFSWSAISRPFRNQKKVYDLRTYKEALTDAQLIELTTI